MAKYRPNISRLYPQRQTPRPSVYDLTNQQRRRGPSQDASVAALIAKGTSLGYSVPTASTQGALSNYVTGLKSAGIWTKLDVLYVFATDGDSDFATLNLKDPNSFQCTKVNSPTFTSLEGFTGNGSSSYLDSNFNLSTDSINYTQNSASFGAYTRNLTVSTSDSFMGATESTIFKPSGDRIQTFINSTGGISQSVGQFTNGFIHVNRTAANSDQLYNNGTEFTGTNTSKAPANLVAYFLLSNGGLLFCNAQISIAFYGGNLQSEASNFFTLTEAYMDALGKGVVA